MIDGVKVKSLVVRKDVPDTDQPGIPDGFLMEVLRQDDDLLEKFGQSTFTIAYPGIIKAFHWHEQQDDLWFVATGRAVVVLHDLRPDSVTFGKTDTVLAGTDDYQLILIPVGVAHGYKVLGKEPVMLFYHTTEAYDAKHPDEKRIPHDDPKINFDWSKYV